MSGNLRGRIPLPRLNATRAIIVAAALASVTGYALSYGLPAQSAPAARGKYLVGLAGCTDCHTPGYFLGQPDMSRYLGGSDVGVEVPGLGVFVGANLTPDNETGLGRWTNDEIAAAIQTGVRPDGRVLAPIMPWRAFAGMTRSDVAAVVAYLKSLPPVSHKVPGPFGVDEKAPIPRRKLLPPES